MFGLRIVVADQDSGHRVNIKEPLIQAGAVIVGEAADGRQAARLIFELQPHLAILDTNLTLRSGLEVAKVIEEQKVCPVILVTSNYSWELLEQVKEAGAYNLLLKPVNANSLLIAAELAVHLHLRWLKVDLEKNKLVDEIEVRKIVEKAKGLLMKIKNIDEEEAYQMMRKLSQDKSKSLKQVAKEIIKIIGNK